MKKPMGDIKTYCIECDCDVTARIERRRETLKVRGELVEYDGRVAACPLCGAVIADSRVEEDNLERAYEAYRTRHGIMSPQEIRRLRERYGLSLREFSRFLGFGEQTVARYEYGALPDELHAAALRRALTAEGAASILAERAESLSEKTVNAVRRFVASGGEYDGPFVGIAVRERWPRAEDLRPSSANGYRGIDLGRMGALISALAARCHDLYWTKLQKAMFFADFLAYDGTSRSLTGLSYAHGTYGPIMNGMGEIKRMLDEGIDGASLEPRGWGEVVVARPGRSLERDEPVFSPEEEKVIDVVAKFVDGFDGARELSDYSHGLRAWSETGGGQIIDYVENAPEVAAAVLKRVG